MTIETLTSTSDPIRRIVNTDSIRWIIIRLHVARHRTVQRAMSRGAPDRESEHSENR